jgi:hypothetical protein
VGLPQQLALDKHNPTSGVAHWEFAHSEWDQRRYPQTIQEFANTGQLLGDKNKADFAAALDAGFHSGGWPGALRKGIEVSLAQRKARNGYVSPFCVPSGLILCLIPCAPIRVTPNWCARSDSPNSQRGYLFL